MSRAISSSRNMRMLIVKLSAAIRKLARRAALACDVELTTEDYLKLFVEPELHDVLRKAGAVAHDQNSANGLNHCWHDADGNIVAILRFEMCGCHPIIIHSNKRLLRRDGNEELVARIDTWVNHYSTVADEFGLAHKVLNVLFDGGILSTLEQVRYVWPCLPALVAMADGRIDLGEFKRPRSMPALTKGLREACRKSSLTVTEALLLPPLEDLPQVKKAGEKMYVYYRSETRRPRVVEGFGSYEPMF